MTKVIQETVMAQVNVSHTLDEELVARLDDVAAVENRSRSNVVEVLLLEALAAREASKPDMSSVGSAPRRAKSA
jgi:metal-responsive CopG/Arc/MetJ family transcriptional regulator